MLYSLLLTAFAVFQSLFCNMIIVSDFCASILTTLVNNVNTNVISIYVPQAVFVLIQLCLLCFGDLKR